MFINIPHAPRAAPDTERVSRPVRPDESESRPPLADIDPADLSESGRRARAEVLRHLRERKARRRGGLRALGRRIRALAGLVAAWHCRARMYDQLTALDDRALKDIGLTRADIENVVRAGRKSGGG
jgi:uncharacterized protein YjiS (DUF1127 family)